MRVHCIPTKMTQIETKVTNVGENREQTKSHMLMLTQIHKQKHKNKSKTFVFIKTKTKQNLKTCN